MSEIIPGMPAAQRALEARVASKISYSVRIPAAIAKAEKKLAGPGPGFASYDEIHSPPHIITATEVARAKALWEGLKFLGTELVPDALIDFTEKVESL